jgi:TolB protein
VAYVSFESNRPAIVIQDIETGSRTRVAEYRGLNSAPVFSPDGNRLALVLSRDGNAEIYVKDLLTGALRRITRYPSAIDTEPSWTPDGTGLIFTSDRGGRPQIYRMDLTNSMVERLTFEGDYNARARLLPDGENLIYVHRRGRTYHIAWQNLVRDDGVRVLTTTSLDESPSIAPNGTMLIYATQVGGRGILAVVSIDGRVKYRLPAAEGDVREPAWSPYLDAFSPGT